MKKRILVLGIMFVFMFILLSTNISARVYFSQVDSIYNLGDVINNEITIDSFEGGFLKVTLICDSGELSFNLLPDEEGVAKLGLPLTTVYIEDVSGNCYFTGEYDGDERQSSNFQISKKLDVSLNVDYLFANPGEKVMIEGSAKRLNGNNVNGDVEISIPVLSILTEESISSNESELEEDAECIVCEEDCVDECEDDEEDCIECEEDCVDECEESIISEAPELGEVGTYYGKVVDGIFSINFTLPNDISSGDYRIDVLVYEEINDEKTSEGIARADLKIFQILTSADIALNNQNFNPGDVVSFKPILLDQAGLSMSEEVSVIIVDEDSERVYQMIVQSDETVEFPLPTNMSAGYYEILATSGEVSNVKKFYVNEKEIVVFEINNETLIVKNVGNIPYDNDIQIDLNGKPFVKSVNLDLGESQKFTLTGENQEYDVKVSDGESEISQSSVVLTGRAIGVKESGGSLNVSFSPIIWIFLILILGAGVLFLFRDVFKKKSFAYPFSKKGKDKVIEMGGKGKSSTEMKNTSKEGKNVPGALVPPNEAEQVLVLKGHKNNASVIALKIKNKISKNAKNSLEKAIEPIYNKLGAVYEQGDFIFVVFSPLMTRSKKNEVEAAIAADKIIKILKEHNKKFKDKIEFGLAINSGDVINKVEDKKLKFTALGNFVTAAKRLAESSDGQILVSKEAYEKGISDMKVEKKQINGGEVYEIKGIIDRAKNKKFLEGFVKRMEGEKK
ncbi:hypothetical protein HOD75_00885 [archaeon]|jgi:hypothetical protein|nr:hypothetical protein [archaeon]MBT4241432.1 hypothetical protein [archaeon]MBT4417697.1 hypothetical protein [archaeon]